MPDIEAYIWDLDGTLLDSYGSIVSSLVVVSRECGVRDSREEILKAVKQGSVSAYLRNLSERTGKDDAGLYRRYREVSHERMDEITLIPGAAETLEALRRAGARHFVYTHRGSSTGPLLDRLGLTDCFEEIVSATGRWTWPAPWTPASGPCCICRKAPACSRPAKRT